ncbi:MAG: omega-amidase [Bacteroidia bacterium]|jgi:omega-amidase
MQNLRVSCVQSQLVWEDVEANLSHFSEQLDGILRENNLDHLVVLPETFNTGFSMNTAKTAEKMNGKTVMWMKDEAQKHNIFLAGSLTISEDNKTYNRLLCISPEGSIQFYNKRHCFTLGNEHLFFEAGQKASTWQIGDWKICPQICYDLRFPVWSRNTTDYHLLLYVANWPQVRMNHWNKILPARAIENQSYTVATNRIGLDGTGKAHSGGSTILDFDGEILEQSFDHAHILSQVLNAQSLLDRRSSFPVLKDSDSFTIH